MKEKVRIGKEKIEKMMENSREVMKLTLELIILKKVKMQI